MSGPDSYLRAVQWVKEYNNKHGDKFASVEQVQINHRMEMFACVVDPFHRRAHSVLQHAGDIVAVEATSSLDLQDTKLVRFVTCSAAGGIPLGYILVSHENEDTLRAAFQAFHALLLECAFRNTGPDLGPVSRIVECEGC